MPGGIGRQRGRRRLRSSITVVLGATVAGLLLPAGPARDAPLAAAPGSAPRTATAPQPFALVELYTSEGCSSCPPADRLLSELVTAARQDGARIFPLAFHVDYWNGLGWTDPWSDAAWSRRQSIYAGAFESRYTPQMVVNGTDKFVGSDRARAHRSIDSALATAAQTAIEAQLVRAALAPELKVRWRVTPVAPGSQVHVALVERGLVSHVVRGENGGRTLRHDNVVLTFETAAMPADGQGETTIVPPEDARLEACSIIVYVQSPKSRRVLGATELEIGPAGAPAP